MKRFSFSRWPLAAAALMAGLAALPAQAQELDSGDTVLSLDVIEDNVYALIKRSDGTYLERADLDSGATTLNPNLLSHS